MNFKLNLSKMCLLMAAFFSMPLFANNIKVSNSTIVGLDTAHKFNTVQFDLSWENSWRHNSVSGGLSYLGVNTEGTGYNLAPKVYIGSQGSKVWQASSSVSAGDLLEVSATPKRYYVVTANHITQPMAPTHNSGTINNLLFVSVSDGGGSGALASANVSGGKISSLTIIASGSGYTTVPTVILAPTNGGSGATADAYIHSWWDAAWVFVKFRVGESDPTFSGVSSSGTTVTVSSTANLRVGMPVAVTAGTGAFAANTVICSITNATQFVVSAAPSTALSNATVLCRRIWEHAALDTTDANHVAASGCTIYAPNDSTGVFINRNSAGTGAISLKNMGLRWNYGSNQLSDFGYVELKIFAIEMVFVPEGSFYVGSGGTESNSLTQANSTSGNTVPFLITSMMPVIQGNDSGSSGANLGARGGMDIYASNTASLAQGFPTGYDAFYCMKYEISQSMYRDFLNTLTYNQQLKRTFFYPNSSQGSTAFNSNNRNWISIRLSGHSDQIRPAVYACNLDGDSSYNEANDGEWIACNELSWMDACAFADWAGLRPMTELEYEKICRGAQSPLANEFAWGNTSIARVTGLSNTGTNCETFSNAGANCVYRAIFGGGVDYPIRVGAFAGLLTNRTQAGAGYWGMLEMSGNLGELAVTIGNSVGRSYTGLHGNGALSADGYANVSNWPGLFNGEVTGAQGSGFRGGTWFDPDENNCVSQRVNAATEIEANNAMIGFRAVRTVK